MYVFTFVSVIKMFKEMCHNMTGIFVCVTLNDSCQSLLFFLFFFLLMNLCQYM